MSGIAVIFWNLSDESVESASALLDFPHVESRMNRAQCTISALAPVRRSGLQPFFLGFADPKTTKTCKKIGYLLFAGEVRKIIDSKTGRANMLQ